MNLAAPGVLRRSLDEREQDINEALCGLPWEEAMRLRMKLRAALGLERAALDRGERRARK